MEQQQGLHSGGYIPYGQQLSSVEKTTDKSQVEKQKSEDTRYSPSQSASPDSNSLEKQKSAFLDQEKRKREIDQFDQKEKEEESSSPVKKVIKIEAPPDLQEAARLDDHHFTTPLIANIRQAFDETISQNAEKEIKEGIIKTREDLIHFVFKSASELLNSPNPISTAAIENIHQLLFTPPLEDLSGKGLENVNLIQPHPAYVFQSLRNCLIAMDGKACASIADESTKYITSESVQNIFTIDSKSIDAIKREVTRLQEKSKLEGGLNAKDQSDLEDFKKFLNEIHEIHAKIDAFPVIGTRQYLQALGSLEAKNINHAYILRDSNSKEQWIFKPEISSFEDEATCNPSRLVEREHAASLVNIDGRFPIPKTVYVEMNGWTGSAQMFIDGAINMDRLDNAPVSRDGLHRLVIFDLLFSNEDRHSANILFKKESGSNVYAPYGIDHDSCMPKYGNALKLDYIALISQDEQFNQNLKPLVSEEALQEYAMEMKKKEMPESAINWMMVAGRKIREDMDTRSARTIIRDLMESWERGHDEDY
ncbi:MULTISPECIES: hypothetical protein [Parachlamydia]|uniref:hypothetical protein n=1 Tax=Parachlamydia TaxID=83551 RepID=UPI0001C17A43|nr:hypothetical protein [Parachlamydia acanthamoebae]EFB42447.1 hypothetical protein pah_c008o062 [Parachlamydia acanthamoebae str. Hall's coccus]